MRVLLCNPVEMAASVPSAPRKVCALARPGGPAVLSWCVGALIGLTVVGWWSVHGRVGRDTLINERSAHCVAAYSRVRVRLLNVVPRTDRQTDTHFGVINITIN